jgi:hypothetical protein
MSRYPHSDRKYSGKFGVSKIYPKYTLKDAEEGELIDAKTVSLVLPFSQATQLADAIARAKAKNPDTVEIKVDRREEKKRKKDGLFPGTVTFTIS